MELTFGRLKTRWQRLIKQNDMLVANVPNVIAACCTLHNICEIHGDTFNEEWLEGIESEDDGNQQPTTTTTTENCPDGYEIRAALMDYFVRNPL